MRSPLAVFGLAILAASACETSRPSTGPDILFVPTPHHIALEMLKLTAVSRDDVVFDLGSGDGRLVIAAAQEFGARGVGIEIDPKLVQESRDNALKAGVAERVTFLWSDLFRSDISAASVVTLYLRDDVNLRLRPKLLHDLAPGTRVVSHDYGMGEWTPDRVVRLRGPDREHVLNYWVIPADVAGTWRSSEPAPAREGGPAAVLLEQRFQRVTGTLSIGGETRALIGTVTANRLRFSAPRTAPGGAEALSFEGTITGDRLAGTVAIPGPSGTRVRPWLARRERAPSR